jgi:transposase-like protein
MTRLSEEAKLVIINKVLRNNGKRTLEIAHTNNIGHSTLKKWVKDFTSAEKISDNQKNSVRVVTDTCRTL